MSLVQPVTWLKSVVEFLLRHSTIQSNIINGFLTLILAKWHMSSIKVRSLICIFITDKAWMTNYTPKERTDVITYPCHKLSYSLFAKGCLGVLIQFNAAPSWGNGSIKTNTKYFHFTHWGRDEMNNISQTTFSNVFSSIKMFEFRWKFHWSLFPRVQLTIFQHWFR